MSAQKAAVNPSNNPKPRSTIIL